MPVSKIKLRTFAACLKEEDRSLGAINKYLRDAAEFTAWLGDRKLTRETAAAWRENLLEENY